MAYAMTYNNLVTDIQQYLERTDAETVARIPTFIALAEQVIASQIKFLGNLTVQNSTMTAANPLGSGANLVPGSSIGVTLNFTANTINFPSFITDGTYMVIWAITGSTAATPLITPALTFSNCSVLTKWFNNSATQLSFSGVNAQTSNIVCLVRITGPNAVITVGTGGTLPTGTVAGDLFITQVNGSM